MDKVACQTNCEHLDQAYLSIVIPAFNEECRIGTTLDSIANYLSSRKESIEVIIVDDGSSDSTSVAAFAFKDKIKNLSVYTLPKNRGKGYAVKYGMLKARGEYRLFNDADGATAIVEVERLEKVFKNDIDLAIGSRALPCNETGVSADLHRKIIGRIFNAIINILVVPGVSDTQCGFKMFSAKAADLLFNKQHIDHFAFDVELLFLARKNRLMIKEVPINWTNIEGSKVNLINDSIKMFRDVVAIRFRHLIGAYK